MPRSCQTASGDGALPDLQYTGT